MRIGFAQIEPRIGEPELNRERALEAVQQARHADLLVLPELCNSGYRFESSSQARDLAEDVNGPFVQSLAGASREYGTTLVAGFCEKAEEGLFNSAVLVTPNGRIGLYRKLHLFLDEKDHFLPGDLGLPVFEVPDGSDGTVRIGMLICFDWQFPESWRTLALREADIVCHPSNLVLPGLAQRCVPVHALLNRLFVVTSNRVGAESDLTFTGGSLVAAPKGEVLAHAPESEVEVTVVEVDPKAARDKSVTARNDLLADRRPEMYET